MSSALLNWSLLAAQVMLALAMACATVRLLQGPRAQDRVLALDTLYVGGMLLLLALFQRKSFPINAALRSLVSVRVAQMNGCAFCVDLNAYNLLKASGSAGKAAAVAHWRSSSDFSDRERAVLEYAEAMTDTGRRVEPVHLDGLEQHFDHDGIVALTAWIAFQNLSAKFNAALSAEDNGLCQLPGKPQTR